jgi:hypothetical protein
MGFVLSILYFVFMVLCIKNLLFGPLLFVALTMFVSFITYRVIESLFINIGRKLSPRSQRTSVNLARQEGSYFSIRPGIITGTYAQGEKDQNSRMTNLIDLA